MAVVPLDASSDALTVGIAQIAPVWPDRAQTRGERVCYVNRAAAENCHWVTFDEALLPGYSYSEPDVTQLTVNRVCQSTLRVIE